MTLPQRCSATRRSSPSCWSLALFVLAEQSDQFFTVDNLLNQGRLMTEVGLIALVMTFVIVTGGIDLSVGSILGLTAILLGVFWKNVGPAAAGGDRPAALVVGTFAGFVNGLIITRFRVPPLIATLGTLALYRGLAEGISQARSVRGYPDWFYVLGQGEVLGVPTQLWLLLACRGRRRDRARPARPGAAPPTRSAPTRSRRASPACRRPDQDRDLLRLRPVAARWRRSIFVSRVSTTRSDMGTGIELDAITAVVLGGTSIFGGRGTIVGTMLGLILIQALKNGLSLAGVKSDGTIVLIGAVLILTILICNLFRPGRQPMN